MRRKPIRSDLHIHTDRSDGALAPKDTIRRAIAGGLDLIALTDHDSANGLDEAVSAAEDTGLRLVPGVEMTASLGSHEIHLLAYFSRFADVREGALAAFLEQVREMRKERIRAGIRALRLRGLLISESEVLDESDRSYTRLHLAQALVAAGYAGSLNEAFRRYLDRKFGSVPQLPVPAEEVIERVHAHGGLVIWAHPHPADVERFLDRLITAGLDGLETHNFRQPTHSAMLAETARRKGLLSTGGSDWHGAANERPLGSNAIGDEMTLPFLEALESRGMQ